MLKINRERLKSSFAAWLEEDIGYGDITNMTIVPVDRPAEFMSKEDGLVAGNQARVRRRRSRIV